MTPRAATQALAAHGFGRAALVQHHAQGGGGAHEGRGGSGARRAGPTAKAEVVAALVRHGPRGMVPVKVRGGVSGRPRARHQLRWRRGARADGPRDGRHLALVPGRHQGVHGANVRRDPGHGAVATAAAATVKAKAGASAAASSSAAPCLVAGGPRRVLLLYLRGLRLLLHGVSHQGLRRLPRVAWAGRPRSVGAIWVEVDAAIVDVAIETAATTYLAVSRNATPAEPRRR